MNNHETNNLYSKSSTLYIILEMLEMVAILGLLFCTVILTNGPVGISVGQLLVYAIWFLIAAISVRLMQRSDRWGAYSLGAATIAVTAYDLVSGYASLGGALLGLVIAVIVIAYLRYSRV